MDRFVLEDDVMRVWNTKNDIDILADALLSGETSNERIAETLMGISTLHDLRCEKLWNTFETLVERGAFQDFDSGPSNENLAGFYKKFNDTI